jgi:hypothetical protein
MKKLLVIFLCLFWGANAKTFYVDPQSGSRENDGSAHLPWRTLEEVFADGLIESYRYKDKPAVTGAEMVVKNEGAAVKGGDTLILKSGFHGKIDVMEYYNSDFIYVLADDGAEPRFESLHLRSVAKWKFKGLFVSPSYAQTYSRQTLIDIKSHGWTGPSRDMILENNTLFSVQNTDSWDIDDWNALPCTGIGLGGVKMTASHNYLKNVNHGINAMGDSAYVAHNIIENFAGDGLRGLGDYSVFEYNTIKNCYNVNDNHDDGFQSWSSTEDGIGTGVVKGVVLRGNTFINWEDPNQPFRGPLQGIGCFDGMFDGWIVENNIVMVDHWHGISFYGATNMIIRNNTVVDLNAGAPGPPWIMITDHKNGTVPLNNVIRNNLATSISDDAEGVILDHNIIIDDYDRYFVDYANGDLSLKAECDAVGTGSSEDAAAFDQLGNRRIVESMDVGAIGFHIAETPTVMRERKIPRLRADFQSQSNHWYRADGRYCPLAQKRSFYPIYSNLK